VKVCEQPFVYERPYCIAFGLGLRSRVDFAFPFLLPTSVLLVLKVGR